MVLGEKEKHSGGFVNVGIGGKGGISYFLSLPFHSYPSLSLISLSLFNSHLSISFSLFPSLKTTSERFVSGMCVCVCVCVCVRERFEPVSLVTTTHLNRMCEYLSHFYLYVISSDFSWKEI